MKLNLGSGGGSPGGYTTVDLYQPAGLQFDIGEAWPLESESVEEIYSSHAFEHVSYRAEETLWDECYRTLKPGGTIHIIVPDFEETCKLFLKKDQTFTFEMCNAGPDRSWGTPMRLIFGHQDKMGQTHLSAYTQGKLKAIAERYHYKECAISQSGGGGAPCLTFLATK
jgi:predicted SAM-dependent methyltransferase